MKHRIRITTFYHALSIIMCLFLCSIKGYPINSSATSSGAKLIKIVGKGEIIAGDASPNGKLLAFITTGKNGHSLYILNLKTGQIQKMEGIGKKAKACRWDGNNTLWFEKEDTKGNLSVWCWKDNAAKASPLPSGAWRPVPSPDGKYVAFRLGVQNGLYIWDSSKKRIQKIPASLYISTYEFSPDGKFLVFIGMSSNQSTGNFTFGTPTPPNEGEIAAIRIPNWEQVQIIDKGLLLRPVRISFIGKNGVVFLKNEVALPSPPPLPKTPNEAKVGEFISTKIILYNKSPEWRAKALWSEKHTKDKFAVSSDGKFLLLPIISSDQNPDRTLLKMVSLSSRREKKVGEALNLKDLFFNKGLGSFLVVTSQKIFSLTVEGKRTDIITLSSSP
jgi:hypothetical protein